MAKISSYPSDANVTTSDRLIGSDNENSNETKNFEVGDIINLASSIILPQVAASYVPYTGATGDVFLGTNDINAGGGIFSYVSSPNIDSTEITPIGSYIYLGNSFNGSSSGIYVPNSYTTILGDVIGNGNGTTISIDDNFQRITFVGGFYVVNGEGTNGQVLISQGAGSSPGWASSLNLDILSINTYLDIFGELRMNNNPGNAGEVLVSQGVGVPPAWVAASTVVQLPYLSAYSSLQQNALGANTATPMYFHTTDLSSNVAIVSNSIITPAYAGVYNIQFSAQIQRTSGGSSATVDIWLRSGGVDVPNTNTSVNVQANAGYLVASWNFFVALDPEGANYDVQIMWATTDTSVILQQQAANAVHPATPSTILTVNKIHD